MDRFRSSSGASTMPTFAVDSVSSKARRIDYAPPQPVWRRRTAKRAFALILFLSIGALGTWKFGPLAWHRVSLVNAQRRCLQLQMPPKLVVFDNDPREGLALRYKDDSQYYLDSAGPVGWCSQDWMKFIALLEPPGRRPSATLYLGTRNTPAGAARLVVVTAYPDTSAGMPTLLISTTVIEQGTVLAPARQLPGAGVTFESRQPLLPNCRVRYFAGQADAADSSHFTVDYEVNSEQYVLDGYLRDDDIVRLESRQLTPPAPSSAASPPSQD